MTDPIQQWIQSSISRQPVPPPPCRHLHWRIDYVTEGPNPGRALVCTDCFKVIGIKPDIRPQDIQTIVQERIVYLDRPAELGTAEWTLIGFVLFIVSLASLAVGVLL